MPQKNITIQIGNIELGKDHPIVIQSMTNTPTADIKATVRQILELHKAGAKIVRITVNDKAAAKAVPKIIKQIGKIPIVGDFHFNGNVLLREFPECAKALAKYRINPGNANDKNFTEMVKIAIKYNKPIRIGINGGSLDQDILNNLVELNSKSPHPIDSDKIFVKAMVQSALHSAQLAEKIGLPKNKIVISGKTSEVQQMIAVYEALDKNSDYVLHLGLTEAGTGTFGTITSSIALGILLQKNIGSTIRVSLTPTPDVPRTQEVEVAKMILQSLELTHFKPRVTSCPGCGRTSSTYFQTLAQNVNTKIDQRIEYWKSQYPGVENLKIAVMGCVVNGPGESKNANIGISLPGTMESPIAPVYIDGKLFKNLKGEHIESEFFTILEEYIQERFTGTEQ